ASPSQTEKLSTPHDAAQGRYPVLAPVSEGYPKDWGRLLTCYSPVRRSIHPPKEALSLDLHVLSTPPAFVLSQDQTLQQKPQNFRESSRQQTILSPKEPQTVQTQKGPTIHEVKNYFGTGLTKHPVEFSNN